MNLCPLSELKNWIQEATGNLERLKVRYPNVDPPWQPPLDIEIAHSKEKATALHVSDSLPPSLRLYTDGNGLNDRIATATISADFHQALLLGITSDAQVFHGKLAGINIGLRILLHRLPVSPEPVLTAVIYSDS